MLNRTTSSPLLLTVLITYLCVSEYYTIRAQPQRCKSPTRGVLGLHD